MDNGTTSVFHIFVGKPQILKSEYTSGTVSGGTINTADSTNHYATTVGTKITKTFEGTAAYFYHFADLRGGGWECKVDGVKKADISTHINAVPIADLYLSLAKRNIASGLENKTHTLEMTFKGDDPNNTPSGGPGTSRGWLRIDSGSSGDPKLNQKTFEVFKLGGLSDVPVIYNSNKEFAFRIREAGSTHNTEWVPEHNSLGTVFLGENGIQELYIDGVPTSMENVISNQLFKEAKIIQILEFKNPNEIGRLGIVTITTTINHKGVSFTSKVSWVKKVEIATGYVNMYTLDREFAKKLVSSMGVEYDLNVVDGTMEYLNEEAPYSFVASNGDMPNYYAYMQNFLPKKTLRLNEAGRKGDAEGNDLYFLQHRDANLQKLYAHTYSDHIANIGEEYQFEGHYGFGKHPRVADLLG